MSASATDNVAWQRMYANTQNLAELLAWLEYGRESGYIAARCPKQQEEYWADLLRDALSRLEFAQGALRDLQLDSDAAREALRLRSENVQLRRGLERIATHDGSGAQSAYCEFSIEMARKILGGEP